MLLRSHFTSAKMPMPTDISVYTVELASAMGNHTRTPQCRWELDPGLGRFLLLFLLFWSVKNVIILRLSQALGPVDVDGICHVMINNASCQMSFFSLHFTWPRVLPFHFTFHSRNYFIRRHSLIYVRVHVHVIPGSWAKGHELKARC